MPLPLRPVSSLGLLLALCGAFCVNTSAAPQPSRPESASSAAIGGTAPASQLLAQKAWTQPLDEKQRINLVLNRMEFGPRPGQAAAVQAMGLHAWMERELHPQSIDDAAVEATSAANFKVRDLKPNLIVLAYAASKNKSLKKKLNVADKGKRQQPGGAEVVDTALLEKLNPRDKTIYEEMKTNDISMGTSNQALGEMICDKLLRAVDSKRQFQEELVDFWSNHFNVDVRKGPVQAYAVVDEKNVIRPRVFSTFRDLLGASAKSASMLWYLDNAKSTVAYTARNGKTHGGINENYGRELMELHTLGVEGGYTQHDVTEVARCFTGWGIDRKTGEFEFNARLHDNGVKVVLGHTIPAGGGQNDGEQVLDMLAASPSTAHFIATRLCQRFVSDNPPASLVKHVAEAFLTSHGDLTTTYQAMIFAPEFLSVGAYHSKVKSPLEFTVSAVRALDGHYAAPSDATPRGRLEILASAGPSIKHGARKAQRTVMANAIAAMGQPLFSCEPPTGYPEDSTTWFSSSALIARLNFAMELTSGLVVDVSLPPNAPTTLPAADDQITGGDLTPTTLATIATAMETHEGDSGRLHALILGSPEFQHR